MSSIYSYSSGRSTSRSNGITNNSDKKNASARIYHDAFPLWCGKARQREYGASAKFKMKSNENRPEPNVSTHEKNGKQSHKTD